MRQLTHSSPVWTALPLALLLVTPAGAEPPHPAMVSVGHATFQTYCGSCHGRTGDGDGPVGQYLNPPPADLTMISARHQGEFPAEEIHEIIDGREIPGHGMRDMPVWGDAFAIADDTDDQAMIHLKIEQLVAYLRSIQSKG